MVLTNHQHNKNIQDDEFDHYRDAYIGNDNNKYGLYFAKYGRYFNLFDATGGKFALTWTWSAFISPPCWLAYKKLYWLIPLSYILTIGSVAIFVIVEAQLYFAWPAGFYCMNYISNIVETGWGIFVFWLLCSVPVRIAIGATGIWFYWHYIKAKIDRAKHYYPGDTDRILVFLKAEGRRANLFLLFALFYFAIPLFLPVAYAFFWVW